MHQYIITMWQNKLRGANTILPLAKIMLLAHLEDVHLSFFIYQ